MLNEAPPFFSGLEPEVLVDLLYLRRCYILAPSHQPRGYHVRCGQPVTGVKCLDNHQKDDIVWGKMWWPCCLSGLLSPCVKLPAGPLLVDAHVDVAPTDRLAIDLPGMHHEQEGVVHTQPEQRL